MGCHGSKQARRDLLRSPSPSPLPRTNSLPENVHLVSLTSSTLGSLDLEEANKKQSNEDSFINRQEANKKQSNEDSFINRQETNKKQSNGTDRPENRDLSVELAKARAWSAMVSTNISRTPNETPPNEPEPVDALELMAGLEADYSPLDRRSFSFFPIGHFDRTEKAEPELELINEEEVGRKKKDAVVVFYFTSLKGIRKTFEDCCLVRSILNELGVRIDERDVSMHSGFREELKKENNTGSLPRVIVNGRELGGAEEVRRMHECGELGKILEGMGVEFREKGETEGVCGVCGDVRFVMCVHCSGSCRVYVEEEKGWRRCSECNENGIVRCPVCC